MPREKSGGHNRRSGTVQKVSIKLNVEEDEQSRIEGIEQSVEVRCQGESGRQGMKGKGKERSGQ